MRIQWDGSNVLFVNIWVILIQLGMKIVNQITSVCDNNGICATGWLRLIALFTVAIFGAFLAHFLFD